MKPKNEKVKWQRAIIKLKGIKAQQQQQQKERKEGVLNASHSELKCRKVNMYYYHREK